MKKAATFFDDILKVTGAAYLIIVIAGFFDLKTYYSHFDVPINEYLTASEIFFSSIDKLLFVLLALIVQISSWLYQFNYFFDYEKGSTYKLGEARPVLETSETPLRLFRSKPTLRFAIVNLIGLAIFSLLYQFFPKTQFIRTVFDFFKISFWIWMCLYLILLDITRIVWVKYKSEDPQYVRALVVIGVFIIVLMASVWLNNASVYPRVFKYGNSPSLEITLSDSSRVFQTDSLRYLGRTEGYVFFWNKHTHQAQIYPKEEIKKIIVHP